MGIAMCHCVEIRARDRTHHQAFAKKNLPKARLLYNISYSFKRKNVGEIKVWTSLEQMRSDCDVRFVHIVHF